MNPESESNTSIGELVNTAPGFFVVDGKGNIVGFIHQFNQFNQFLYEIYNDVVTFVYYNGVIIGMLLGDLEDPNCVFIPIPKNNFWLDVNEEHDVEGVLYNGHKGQQPIGCSIHKGEMIPALQGHNLSFAVAVNSEKLVGFIISFYGKPLFVSINGNNIRNNIVLDEEEVYDDAIVDAIVDAENAEAAVANYTASLTDAANDVSSAENVVVNSVIDASSTENVVADAEIAVAGAENVVADAANAVVDDELSHDGASEYEKKIDIIDRLIGGVVDVMSREFAYSTDIPDEEATKKAAKEAAKEADGEVNAEVNAEADEEADEKADEEADEGSVITCDHAVVAGYNMSVGISVANGITRLLFYLNGRQMQVFVTEAHNIQNEKGRTLVTSVKCTINGKHTEGKVLHVIHEIRHITEIGDFAEDYADIAAMFLFGKEKGKSIAWKHIDNVSVKIGHDWKKDLNIDFVKSAYDSLCSYHMTIMESPIVTECHDSTNPLSNTEDTENPSLAKFNFVVGNGCVKVERNKRDVLKMSRHLQEIPTDSKFTSFQIKTKDGAATWINTYYSEDNITAAFQLERGSRRFINEIICLILLYYYHNSFDSIDEVSAKIGTSMVQFSSWKNSLNNDAFHSKPQNAAQIASARPEFSSTSFVPGQQPKKFSEMILSGTKDEKSVDLRQDGHPLGGKFSFEDRSLEENSLEDKSSFEDRSLGEVSSLEDSASLSDSLIFRCSMENHKTLYWMKSENVTKFVLPTMNQINRIIFKSRCSYDGLNCTLLSNHWEELNDCPASDHKKAVQIVHECKKEHLKKGRL